MKCLLPARSSGAWASLILIVVLASVRDMCAAPPDIPFLLEFLAGDYRLIGQQPNSGPPYVGKVSFREHNGEFKVVRSIGDITVHGTGSIVTAGEGTAVLRCRFTVADIGYEASYLWRSDMDNYPRLTGYVYRSKGETKSPGLEALFHVPPTPPK